MQHTKNKVEILRELAAQMLERARALNTAYQAARLGARRAQDRANDAVGADDEDALDAAADDAAEAAAVAFSAAHAADDDAFEADAAADELAAAEMQEARAAKLDFAGDTEGAAWQRRLAATHRRYALAVEKTLNQHLHDAEAGS